MVNEMEIEEKKGHKIQFSADSILRSDLLNYKII